MSHLSLQMYNHRNKTIIETRDVKYFSPHLKWPYWIFLPDFDIVVLLEWQTSNSQTPGCKNRLLDNCFKNSFVERKFLFVGILSYVKNMGKKRVFKKTCFWLADSQFVLQYGKQPRAWDLRHLRFSLMWLRHIQDFWRLLKVIHYKVFHIYFIFLVCHFHWILLSENSVS